MDPRRLVARTEAFFKGMVFDCRSCGQCVLDKTGLICPMSCPKGLRNGPCGGTLAGRCEVYPDKECVWIRIHERTAPGRLDARPLLASPDAALFHSSSYLNRLAGRDIQAQAPLPPLPLASRRAPAPVATASALERALKSGRFVHTCELRSPREPDLSGLRAQVERLQGVFDAVNVTAHLNGRPSLPSVRAAIELARLGVEAVVQSTCRDHTKTSFVAELMDGHLGGVRNVLCLTGDSYAGTPKIKQVFDMDSALMLYEARHLRETGVVHFTGARMNDQPRPYLGAAINPFSTPVNVPVRRLAQKALAGADFVQTQLVFDVEAFAAFMRSVCAQRLHEELFVIAGVPVVTSRQAWQMLPRMPGVHLPAALAERMLAAPDARDAGIGLARDIVERVRRLPGVAGVHLMLIGTDHALLPEIVAR